MILAVVKTVLHALSDIYFVLKPVLVLVQTVELKGQLSSVASFVTMINASHALKSDREIDFH